jgi:hypothetical protein
MRRQATLDTECSSDVLARAKQQKRPKLKLSFDFEHA